MSNEELAPEAIRTKRIERQEKHFKEQVLMEEETKIIAKTHKGESILTVGDSIVNYDDKKKEKESNDDEVKSQKGSWYSNSDNEEKTVKKIVSVSNKTVNKQDIEPIKYPNLNEEMKELYYRVLELTPVYLINVYFQEKMQKKLQDKLKAHLNAKTLLEFNLTKD